METVTVMSTSVCRYKENEALLSAWIDGDLEPTEAEDLERHLELCQRCRSVVDDLRALKVAAGGLAEEPVPSATDGWQQVRGRLHTSAAREGRLRRWLVLAAAAVVLVSVGAIVTGVRTTDRTTSAEARARLELTKLQRQQQRAVAALQVVVDQRRGDWDADLKQTFHRNLALVDRAIEECRRALKRRPTDLALRASLMAAYQRKVEFLELFTGNAGEDAR
jgi:anti-sigma factor RsiW